MIAECAMTAVSPGLLRSQKRPCSRSFLVRVALADGWYGFNDTRTLRSRHGFKVLTKCSSERLPEGLLDLGDCWAR